MPLQIVSVLLRGDDAVIGTAVCGPDAPFVALVCPASEVVSRITT